MSLAVKASSLDTFFIFNLKVDSFNHFLTLWVMKQPMVIMVKGTYIHQTINMGAKAGDKATSVLNSYDLVAVRPLQ